MIKIKINSWKTRIFAVILDSDGNIQSQTKIDKKETFKVKNRRYTTKGYEKSTVMHIKRLIFNDYYFFFHHKELKPLSLKFNPTVKAPVTIYPDTDLINTILEADTLRKLNDLSKPNPFGNIDPKMVLMGLIAVAVAIYFLTGGQLI